MIRPIRFGAAQTQRRYDLDWLRIIVFTLLIFYHIGMFYSPWAWHVKSAHAPLDFLELPMLLSQSWRLPLLFLVSGVAIRYALDKSQPGAFLSNRIYRLFVPLLFGIIVICAPQTYFELVQADQFSGTIWEFYKGYITMPWASPENWPMITPTWNHLWYLLYVLVYTLIIGLANLLFKGRFPIKLDCFADWTLKTPTTSLVSVLPIFFVIIRYIFDSSYHSQQTLWGDWHRLVASFLILLLGYTIAKNETFWVYLKSKRRIFLMTSVVTSILVSVDVQKDIFDYTIRAVVQILHGWSMLYMILGFSQNLLNRDSTVLRYLTAAIFPYYVLHQTIIICVGVPLTGLGYSPLMELAILVLTTVAGCIVVHHFAIQHMGRWGVIVGWVPKNK